MKIKFLGAARTVTGSCFLIEACGHRFVVDCGMHQGNKEIDKRNWNTALYEPGEIEFVLVTHAHIDHTGLLPRLVQAGFADPIHATPPTRDLMEIMLLDSAHIQEMEAKWKNNKRLRRGEAGNGPLYTQVDAQATFPLIQAHPYDAPFAPCDGVAVTFRDAGHILGASFIEMVIDEDGKRTKLVFSGDIGRPAQLIVRDPQPVAEADYLFLESTYGNRDHKNERESLNELADAIAYSYRNGEKVVIPAFAVERTQEMLYCLHLLGREGKLPQDMPVYVDSPLAIKATEIFRRYAEFFDEEAKKLIARGDDPFRLHQLRLTETTEDSMAINRSAGPAVVISASGMADAGRIKHHLRHNLWRPGASVVFVGFQAQGTTGRRIVDGAPTVRLFNEDIAVQAKIYTINGFSSHAGQSQLLAWLSNFRSPAMEVFLVHGEYGAQQTFASLIRERFGLPVEIPDYLDEITLQPGREPGRVAHPDQAAPRIDWTVLVGAMEQRLALLRARTDALEGKAWVEQTDLRDRLLEVDRDLMKIISEL